MNTSSNSSGILLKSAISFLILIVVGAIVYMYFNAFILEKNTSDEVAKTQEEIENERRTAQISAPPREDIQLTEERSTEIQSDLRTTPEPTGSETNNDEVRSQLVN